MYVILGLGNPGENYRRTRHNAGFWAVEELAKESGVTLRKRRGYDFGEAEFYTEGVYLARPLTFMNLSGKAARKIRRKMKVDPHYFVVIHDDIDLKPGTIRIRKGGSSAGHLGVQSVIESLGSPDFPRIRVGPLGGGFAHLPGCALPHGYPGRNRSGRSERPERHGLVLLILPRGVWNNECALRSPSHWKRPHQPLS